MNIYLIRHADAEKSSSNVNESDRKLTKEGKATLRTAAEKWKTLTDSFDYIISSPLTRTVQTAKIIADVFHYKNEIVTEKMLAEGGSTEDLINIINSLDGEEIAVIGHQPDMSQHLAKLISNGSAHLEFKKAAVAKISFHNRAHLSKGILEFLIPPAILK